MDRLWTNRKAFGDFVRNALSQYQSSVSNVYIAVAFFTGVRVIENLLLDDCHVRIVVRLGFPTNPWALRKLLNNSNVEVRYYIIPRSIIIFWLTEGKKL